MEWCLGLGKVTEYAAFGIIIPGVADFLLRMYRRGMNVVAYHDLFVLLGVRRMLA